MLISLFVYIHVDITLAILYTFGYLFELILNVKTYVRIAAILIRYLVFIVSTPVDLNVSSVFN